MKTKYIADLGIVYLCDLRFELSVYENQFYSRVGITKKKVASGSIPLGTRHECLNHGGIKMERPIGGKLIYAAGRELLCTLLRGKELYG